MQQQHGGQEGLALTVADLLVVNRVGLEEGEVRERHLKISTTTIKFTTLISSLAARGGCWRHLVACLAKAAEACFNDKFCGSEAQNWRF